MPANLSDSDPKPIYRGRFAPSPTGPLHIGSLLTAVASYLDARSQQGTWLVRMEDIDPPREQAGAADTILSSLEAHGLCWDEELVYQSQRLQSYEALVEQLQQQDLAYACTCSRQKIKQAGGIYPGFCRQHPADTHQPHAIRLKSNDLPENITAPPQPISYADIFQGQQCQHVDTEVGDFIIRRRDGLVAYQLAVVADDIAQGITHVIRGCDLLDNTARQLWLFALLKAHAPAFGHVPIIVNDQGQKLSKQTFAAPLDDAQASSNLITVLQQLNHAPPAELHQALPKDILDWGIANWSRQQLPHTQQLVETSS